MFQRHDIHLAVLMQAGVCGVLNYKNECETLTDERSCRKSKINAIADELTQILSEEIAALSGWRRPPRKDDWAFFNSPGGQVPVTYHSAL